MKRIIALVLAVIMVALTFGLTGCGKKDVKSGLYAKNNASVIAEGVVDLAEYGEREETTTAISGFEDDLFNTTNRETTTAGINNPEKDFFGTTNRGTTATETTADDFFNTTGRGTTAVSEDDDPAYWTTADIVAFYNKARHANRGKTAPAGHQTMKLSGDITGDGAIGTILKVLNPAVDAALTKNSKDIDFIPAVDHSDVLVSDVQTASAKKDANGNVVITILFKNQVDGPDGDSNNGGPVARGVGTLGSIDTVLNELGAEITEGRDTVSLTYTNAYVKDFTVNPDTMAIKSGTFHYFVSVKIVNAKGKLGIAANIQNLKAYVDYTAVVG